MIRAPKLRHNSSVSSVLKESTTRISSAHRMDSNVARTVAAQLYVGKRTEIGGRLMAVFPRSSVTAELQLRPGSAPGGQRVVPGRWGTAYDLATSLQAPRRATWVGS